MKHKDTQKWQIPVGIESENPVLTKLPESGLFFLPNKRPIEDLIPFFLGAFVKRVLAAIGTAKPKAFWLERGR